MRQYAYRIIKKGSLTQPVTVGAITADSMDDAVQAVINRVNIDTVHEGNESGWNDHYFMLNDVKVSILIYANPSESR